MNERIYRLKFSKVYPLLVQKVERKGRTQDELNQIIYWLTGYDEAGLQRQLEQEVDYETFFANAPRIHPNAHQISGLICGIRVEDIEDPLVQKARWLDKLVDELAKGKSMAKIIR